MKPMPPLGGSEPTQYINDEYLAELEIEMRWPRRRRLEFERAAALRDRVQQMRSQIGKPVSEAKVEQGKETRQAGEFRW